MRGYASLAYKPLVSVIIPVYNVEKYLDSCVKSVVSQDYQNIEIILVDDGATDSSGEKCDSWAKKDNRIRVIHKKNEGLNYARRDGFKKSSGEYITFLDSDDLLHKQSISVYLQAILDNKAEVAVAGFVDFNSSTKDLKDLVISAQESYKMRILQSKKEIMSYAVLGEPSFPDANYMTACGKLYFRELIEKVDWRQSNFLSYEDNFWTPQVLMGAKAVVLISSQLYFYRRNITYASGDKTLGNRLVGNTFNGKPVGFLEYLTLLHNFHDKLSKRYGFDMVKELEEVHYQWSWNRLSVLIEAEAVDAENNLQYLKDIWSSHQQRDWQLQQQYVELNGKLSELNKEIARLNDEYARFYSIKYTSKRLLGNIKRKIFNR